MGTTGVAVVAEGVLDCTWLFLKFCCFLTL